MEAGSFSFDIEKTLAIDPKSVTGQPFADCLSLKQFWNVKLKLSLNLLEQLHFCIC
jgi:hypothetical protein